MKNGPDARILSALVTTAHTQIGNLFRVRAACNAQAESNDPVQAETRTGSFDSVEPWSLHVQRGLGVGSAYSPMYIVKQALNDAP